MDVTILFLILVSKIMMINLESNDIFERISS